MLKLFYEINFRGFHYPQKILATNYFKTTVCDRASKRHQVDTKYTISQNHNYLTFCVKYLLSVSFKLLFIKLFIYGKNLILMA